MALTLAVGLTAAGGAWWAVGSIAARAIDASFARSTAGVAARVDSRLTDTESTILAIRGLLDASVETTPPEFARFVGALTADQPVADRFPGVTALAVVTTDGTVTLAAPEGAPTRTSLVDALGQAELAAGLARATDLALPVTVSLPAGEVGLAVAVARYDDPRAAEAGTSAQQRRQAVLGWVLALVDVDRLLTDVVLVSGDDQIAVTLRDASGTPLGAIGAVAPDEAALARDMPLERLGDALELGISVDSVLPGQAGRVPGLVLLLGSLLALAGAGLVWLLVTQRERALLRVEEATTALAASNRELEEANERLREFAGVVAHDLRGPLTAVHGMITTLATRIGDQLDPLDTELLTRARRSSMQMDELIVDVLRYAEAGVAPTDLRVLDLHDVVAEVVERLEPARQPDDVIHVAAAGAVLADPTGLRRVLGNLIGNALKYGRDGGPARVEVRTRRQYDRVVIEVADDGPGIPAALRAELLTPFRRGDTSQAGSGLGLAICTRIVMHHGGTLELTESERGGTLVRFDLPGA